MRYLLSIVLISLIACTVKSDDTEPIGYPFDGDSQDLKFRYFDKMKFGYPNSSTLNFFKTNKIKFIDNKIQCDSIVGMNCQCNCDEVDFNAEIIAHKEDTLSNVIDGGFKVRATIHHRSKSVRIATTEFSTKNKIGFHTVEKTIYYYEWLIIPKPPLGYSLIILDY